MFIAIEGSDGAGKSSLIEAIKTELLAKQPDLQIVDYHKSRPPEETRECLLYEYATSLENTDLYTSTHVADRWHWGERTYAPIKRPHTNTDGYGLLGKAGWRWVELFMQSRGMAQILLFQKLDVIRERVTERGDDYIDLSELEAIYNAYVETSQVAILAEMLMPGKLGLESLPHFAGRAIDVAKATAERTKFLRAYPNYIGPILPKLLIVGDDRSDRNEFASATDLPFVPTIGSDAEFLLNSLPEDLWKHVGIVSTNSTSADELSKLHKQLGRPMIAALGMKAERLILKTTIYVNDYAAIRDPQYVWGDARDEYGLQLQEISKRKNTNK
jgi:ribose 1,5-bisphosphokinase PhnN